MRKAILALTCLFPMAAIAADGKPGSHFLQNWDLDSDGSVTLAELRERRDNVFTTFDESEDGFLSAEEYEQFDEARKADMEGNGNHNKGRARRMQDGMTLKFNDTDGDGRVSREEFLAMSADWMKAIDRNGDGEVTTADFGPRN